MKHLLRRLSRTPSFTIVAVITLALGIGANTAMFTVVYGILLKPLPFPESERLIGVWHTAKGIGMDEVACSPAAYFTYLDESRAFERVGLWKPQSVTVTGSAEPENTRALNVTFGILPALRVQPAAGRWFTPAEDAPGGAETVILSWGYWQRRFGGDRGAIGRTVTVDGRPREIIGILPANFRFMDTDADLLLPFRFDRAQVFVGNFSYMGLARLKPGVTLDQARADLSRMDGIMKTRFPLAKGMSLQMFETAQLRAAPRPLKADLIGNAGASLWIVMATVGIVLLVACANVANLLLVRAEARRHEFAIRAALGAGRARIAREILSESVALGAAGGILGVALANALLDLLVYLGPSGLPRLREISLDPVALAFACLVSIAAGLLFGLPPVWKYSGARGGLREGGRTASDGRERHRARGVLVVAQVAMALVLLVGSGLMIRTLRELRRVEPGFRSPETIQTVRVAIPYAVVPDSLRAVQTHADIIRKIAAIPGVRSVSGANSITMDGDNDNDPIFAEDRPQDAGRVTTLRRYKYVAPGMFATMGNRVLAGRDFQWEDAFSARRVVLVSETLARELWGSAEAAIGKRVRETPSGVWREIVGVAGDERDNGVDQAAPGVVYWPLLVKNIWQMEQRAERTLAYAIRTERAGTAALVAEVQRAVWSVNPDLPVADVRTVKQIYDRSMARTSFVLVMLSIAAGMALLLGVIGLYGVLSYAVAQRTREIGIRMALGAQQTSVRRMFLRHGLMLAAAGIAIGSLAAAALSSVLRSLLFGVTPLDPVTYAAVAGVLLAAAALAAWIPARRATSIEPVQALRES